MEPKRVLIVEPDSAFALSLASLYRDDGCVTAVAPSAAEAEREIRARLPDLVVVRAELPDLSGFSFCGRLRRDRPGLPVLLFSSESTAEALAEHARTPAAADAYLAMPLDTAALARVSRDILAAPAPVEVEGDAVVEETPPVEVRIGEAPAAPPPAAAAPPPVPRRETRGAVTDEDRLFLARTFQSIAERRADLLAESRRRRPPPPRHLIATPEGKLSLLREDLKAREAQIARLAEIWETRERETAQAGDRIHEKDVEIQSLKLQVDELLRKLAGARDLLLRKEAEHGASVEGLLLDRFSQEKELIEVVAAKERRINELEREVRLRDDDLARRRLALDASVEEIGRLEQQGRADRERAEARERDLTASLGARETDLGAAQKALADARARAAEEAQALRSDLAATAASLAGVEAELASSRERQAEAAARIGELEAHAASLAAETDREREAARAGAAALQARIDEREEAIREREERLSRLDEEARRAREAARDREEEWARERRGHLERIAALERAAEAAAAEAAGREAQLRAEAQRAAEETARAREAREADAAAWAARTAEWEGRLAAAEGRQREERRHAQEELARREAVRAQEVQRWQARIQEAARRIEAMQRELVRRPPAPPAGGSPAAPAAAPAAGVPEDG